MDNLLERASLVLTASAYNDAELLCVKPEDGSGDFDFSRNSSATRVNAQGLVEDVQILSGELVTNGDFSNGSTGWTLGDGWSIGVNEAICDGTQTSSSVMAQDPVTNTNTDVKVSFTISGYVSGLIRVRNSGGFAGAYVSGNDTYVFYTNTANVTNIVIDADTDFIGSITNISVIEITNDTNLPRINYENGCGHLLFEPQSTNLITYSEDFSDAIWTGGQTNATITASTNVNPSGNSGTYLVERTTGTQTQLGAVVSVTAGLSYTGSFYVRNVSGSGAITLSDVNNVPTPFIATDKWQRFSVMGVASGAGRLYINLLTTGDVVEVWGAMLEEQSYATSYIPTEGVIKTRNQDVCTNGGDVSLINSTEGTLYFEGSALESTVSQEVAFSINDGVNNRLLVRFKTDGKIGFIAFTNGVGIRASGETGVLDQSINKKIALKYKENDYALWVNGIEVVVDNTSTTFALETLTKLSFEQGNNGSNFFGKTKALAVYTTALSDAKLTELTTI